MDRRTSYFRNEFDGRVAFLEYHQFSLCYLGGTQSASRNSPQHTGHFVRAAARTSPLVGDERRGAHAATSLARERSRNIPPFGRASSRHGRTEVPRALTEAVQPKLRGLTLAATYAPQESAKNDPTRRNAIQANESANHRVIEAILDRFPYQFA